MKCLAREQSRCETSGCRNLRLRACSAAYRVAGESDKGARGVECSGDNKPLGRAALSRTLPLLFFTEKSQSLRRVRDSLTASEPPSNRPEQSPTLVSYKASPNFSQLKKASEVRSLPWLSWLRLSTFYLRHFGSEFVSSELPFSLAGCSTSPPHILPPFGVRSSLASPPLLPDV